MLDDLSDETRTIIIYEAPHHLKGTLKELYSTLGDRRITLCRELTKKFESVMPTTISGAIAYYEDNEPRGEYVLVIEGKTFKEQKEELRQSYEDMTKNDGDKTDKKTVLIAPSWQKDNIIKSILGKCRRSRNNTDTFSKKG